MTMPASGLITLSQADVELGRASTAPISLGESAVRTLAGVPSGLISLSSLYGKSAAAARVVYAGTRFDGNLNDVVSGAWNAGSAYVAGSGSKFGGGSFGMDNASGSRIARLNRNITLSTPWCVEWWWHADYLDESGISTFYVELGAYAKWSFTIDGPSITQSPAVLILNSSGGTVCNLNDTGATGVGDALGTPRHFSFGWDGTTYRYFVDGTLRLSASSTTPPGNATYVRVGHDGGDFLGSGVWVDDICVTNKPRTANFSVPTSAFAYP